MNQRNSLTPSAMNSLKYQIDYEPHRCSRSRVMDDIRHVLGNFVAANFGIRTLRRCAGSGFKTRDEQVAAERFAEIASNSLRIRGSVVVVLLRGGCFGQINLSQRRRLYGSDGI